MARVIPVLSLDEYEELYQIMNNLVCIYRIIGNNNDALRVEQLRKKVGILLAYLYFNDKTGEVEEIGS